MLVVSICYLAQSDCQFVMGLFFVCLVSTVLVSALWKLVILVTCSFSFPYVISCPVCHTNDRTFCGLLADLLLTLLR